VPHLAAYVADFPAPLDRYLLAYGGAEAVGLVGLRAMAPGVAEVKRLYVVPSHRRQGVATALLDAVAGEARRGGYRTLRLDSPRARTGAVALYTALGWRPIPPWDHSGDETVAFELSL
jgi:GNAT superfamily N-acetyltransferase